MSETFYFHVSKEEDDDCKSSGVNPHYICFVGKSFWDMEGCIDDNHIADFIIEQMGEEALADFYEEAESTFSTTLVDLTRDQLIEELERRGFVQNSDFGDWLEG